MNPEGDILENSVYLFSTSKIVGITSPSYRNGLKLENLNFLIGPNSSGKSRLLKNFEKILNGEIVGSLILESGGDELGIGNHLNINSVLERPGPTTFDLARQLPKELFQEATRGSLRDDSIRKGERINEQGFFKREVSQNLLEVLNFEDFDEASFLTTIDVRADNKFQDPVLSQLVGISESHVLDVMRRIDAEFVSIPEKFCPVARTKNICEKYNLPFLRLDQDLIIGGIKENPPKILSKYFSLYYGGRFWMRILEKKTKFDVFTEDLGINEGSKFYVSPALIPRVIDIPANVLDGETIMNDRVIDLLKHANRDDADEFELSSIRFDDSAWELSTSADGTLEKGSRLLNQALSQIVERVNRLLPSFIGNSSRLSIWQDSDSGKHGLYLIPRSMQIEDAWLESQNVFWDIFLSRPGDISLLPGEDEDNLFEHYRLINQGLGVRRWVNASIDIVLAGSEFSLHWHKALKEVKVTLGFRHGLQTALFIDEPEIALHPAAVESVSDWLNNLNQIHQLYDIVDFDHSSIFAATHCVDLIASSFHSNCILLTSNGSMLSSEKARNIGNEFVEYYLQRSFFFGSHQIFGSGTRARKRPLLIVEGDADKIIIQQWYGSRLEEFMIDVLSLGGTSTLYYSSILPLLKEINCPIFFLFDGKHNQKIVTAIERAKLKDSKIGFAGFCDILVLLDFAQVFGKDRFIEGSEEFPFKSIDDFLENFLVPRPGEGFRNERSLKDDPNQWSSAKASLQSQFGWKLPRNSDVIKFSQDSKDIEGRVKLDPIIRNILEWSQGAL